jgi:hypothetical protein
MIKVTLAARTTGKVETVPFAKVETVILLDLWFQ